MCTQVPTGGVGSGVEDDMVMESSEVLVCRSGVDLTSLEMSKGWRRW